MVPEEPTHVALRTQAALKTPVGHKPARGFVPTGDKKHRADGVMPIIVFDEMLAESFNR
jgi:hypothetical protein